MRIFVTGGAGFIGSQFIRSILRRFPEVSVVNYDKLTYAGNLANLRTVEHLPNYQFVRGDICDGKALLAAIPEACDAVVHFAAESHVDRSIHGAHEFVLTNVLGTQILLDAARNRKVGRFLHISTDEVGGTMEPNQWLREDAPLDPRSPYAASKAAAEHMVRAAGATFGIDYVITRTSNNYGPCQFPEKLLPLAICNLFENQPVPVYGDGLQVRDWIHVDDNCRALIKVLFDGRAGETYHICGGHPRTNLDVLKTLLNVLGKPESMLQYVKDRPGHDRRYAVDYSKTSLELNWQPVIGFEDGLRDTVDWYSYNRDWVSSVRSGEYMTYYTSHYGNEFSAGALVA
jgi:dTDP-glucose 4,6-dehydratase